MHNDQQDGRNEVSAEEKDFVQLRKPGEINVSDFKRIPGKYITTVFDEDKIGDEEIIYESNRTQIRATYIKDKNQITALNIQKFDIIKGVLQSNPAVVQINTTGLGTLKKFLDFLSRADLSSVAAGTLTFEKDIQLDADLDAKLKSLASDTKGKEKLLKLFTEGYLTSGLDIPELIKKGLSGQVVEEKLSKIEAFKSMIDDPDIKEVSDIQEWLQQNPWIFGPEYKSLDFRDAGSAGNPDGRLLRIDGLSDILEVKLPNAELLRMDDMERQFIAPALAEAIGQLTGYLEHYCSAYSEERDDITEKEILEDRYGKYYKPKGIILIGRRLKENGTNTMSKTTSAEPKKLRRLLSYYHGVEVITYDDLLERARNGINFLVK